jgi:hypothetical protein
MKKTAKIMLIFSLLCITLLALSCTPGVRLNYQGTQASEVTGTYTVIFYGCNFLDDPETIAFLDKEGDQYTFEPYAPDFKYRVKKGIDGKDALAEAMKFVSCNTAFRRSQLSRILAPNGDTLGYEVRPLYQSFVYGADDVLYTDYRLKDHKVIIYVRLIPSIQMMLEGGGGRERER